MKCTIEFTTEDSSFECDMVAESIHVGNQIAEKLPMAMRCLDNYASRTGYRTIIRDYNGNTIGWLRLEHE